MTEHQKNKIKKKKSKMHTGKKTASSTSRTGQTRWLHVEA